MELPAADATAGDQLDQQEARRRKPARGAAKESAFDRRLAREMALKTAHENSRKKKRGGPLTDEERKAKKKAYMKAYWQRKKGANGKRVNREDNGKGIPAGQFNKLLVKGPISQGGNGEE